MVVSSVVLVFLAFYVNRPTGVLKRTASVQLDML